MSSKHPDIVKTITESAGIGFRVFSLWFLLTSVLSLLTGLTVSFVVVSSILVGFTGFLLTIING